jgi:hypothetical protein
MVLLSYMAVGFVVGLAISLAIRGGWRRQYLLALACPASLGALVGIALVRGCPPNAHECSPELTLFLGALLGGCVTIGWCAGIGVAALVRRARQSRPGSSSSQGVQ